MVSSQGLFYLFHFLLFNLTLRPYGAFKFYQNKDENENDREKIGREGERKVEGEILRGRER